MNITGLETTIIASVTALLAASLTYITTSRRDSLHTRFEICKYREKWLSELRFEMSAISSLYISRIEKGLTGTDIETFFGHFSKINLLLSSSNSHRSELDKTLKDMIETFGNKPADDFKEKPAFDHIAKKILEEEWIEIQNLLHGNRKHNAKNK